MRIPLQPVQDLIRLRHIAQVLIRNGLGFVLERIGLARLLTPRGRGAVIQDKRMARLSIPERMRHTLEELGPTYVKLGQLLSTRPDLLPPEFIAELSKLLDAVPPFEGAIARARIEHELGKPVEELFAEFDPTPVASASIGQVHYATLPSGERVVVKVQRPEIRHTIEADINLLLRQARFLEERSALLRDYQLVDLVDEFGRSLQDELDYVREGRNAERVTQALRRYSNVRIPQIHWHLTTSQVITMEDVRGINLTDPQRLREAGHQPTVIADQIATIYYHQIFAAGLFHADPHPANLLVHEKGLSLVDFGLVGFISEGIKEDLRDLFIALMAQDVEQIVDIVLRMGAVSRIANRAHLVRDIQRLLHRYYGVTIDDISIGEFLKEITQVAFSHHIRLPSDLALLARTMIILEGVILNLDPDFNMVEFAKPFFKTMLRERYSLERLSQGAQRTVRGAGQLLTALPQRTLSILGQLDDGDLTVGIEVGHLVQIMRRLDAVANRLAFSIVVAALIIGSALIIQGGAESLVLTIPLVNWQLPVAPITFLAAGILAVWLLITMIRSKGL
jgi:ubiquinone biosynthesis protein